MALDPGLKRGHGQGCGNRGAILLGEGLWSVQGLVAGNVKGGMSWSCGSSSSGSLLLEHVDLLQTMPELVQRAEPGLLLLDCSDGQSSSSRHVCLLVVLHGPLCCTPLDFLNGVVAADGVGVSYGTGELKEGSPTGLVNSRRGLLQDW